MHGVSSSCGYRCVGFCPVVTVACASVVRRFVFAGCPHARLCRTFVCCTGALMEYGVCDSHQGIGQAVYADGVRRSADYGCMRYCRVFFMGTCRSRGGYYARFHPLLWPGFGGKLPVVRHPCLCTCLDSGRFALSFRSGSQFIESRLMGVESTSSFMPSDSSVGKPDRLREARLWRA